MNLPGPWTTPAQVRAFIASFWSAPPGPSAYNPALGSASAGELSALLGMIDALDPGVLLAGIRGTDIARWVPAVGKLRFCVDTWRTGTEWAMKGVKFGVVNVIDELLAKCPEQPTPPALPRLPFIADAKLRENVARDIESLDALFAQKEWKAATVLAGSVAEALLLNAVEDKLTKAGKTLDAYGAGRGWKDAPDRWGLDKFVQAALDLDLLTEASDVSLVRACQGYRNLIHPGRERMTFPHDEGVAHGAVGAAKRLLAILGS